MRLQCVIFFVFYICIVNSGCAAIMVGHVMNVSNNHVLPVYNFFTAMWRTAVDSSHTLFKCILWALYQSI